MPDYGTGLEQLVDGEIDVFFGDLSLVLGALDGENAGNVTMMPRMFMWNTLID